MRGQSSLDDQAAEALQAHASLCRNDPLEFNAFVLRDEDTGDYVNNTENHAHMQTCVDEFDRSIVLAHIESGKTYAITVGRTLYQLMHNRNMRGAIVSAKEGLAIKPLRAIKSYIEKSSELHLVAPELHKGPRWRETEIIIERDIDSRDPSIVALGIGSQFLGSRFDWVVGDDLLTHDNTKTAYRRQEVCDWFHATIMGRLTRNAKVILVNTAWHENDLLHRLGRRKMWFMLRCPVARDVLPEVPVKASELDDVSRGVGEDGKIILSNWPERWPASRIREFTEAFGGRHSKETKKQLYVEPVREDDTTFNEDYIRVCQARGPGLSMCNSLEAVREMARNVRPREGNRYVKEVKLYDLDQDFPVFHGVDLGARRNAKSGKTVIFSGIILPDGSRLPFRIKIGRFGGPQIRDLIVETHEIFGGLFMVENNATQHWIIEFTLETDQLPIFPFTTGSNKANPDFGVDTLATEFSQGSWIIPCSRDRQGDGYQVSGEVGEWLDGLRDHDKNSHTADTTMASWFFREAARRHFGRGRRRGGGNTRAIVLGGGGRRSRSR